jgi:hypothetical protein
MIKLRESDTIWLKKSTFPSQELIRSKHDQSIVERTLPRAILLLGLMSRDLTTLGLFVLIFLIFGKSDIVKWSDRPKGAIFSGLSKN